LHNFTGGNDGGIPNASLILDSAGNLYGDTFQGGRHGVGTVFMLSPGSNGTWKEKVLHHFTGSDDGAYPQAVLVLDAAGNVYGTASGGGILGTGCHGPLNGCGTVFELKKGSNGGWAEKTLYEFAGAPDAIHSLGGLVFDAKGNLYGTTYAGGTKGYGTVFELKKGKNVAWSERIVHNFNFDGTDGAVPVIGLTSDSSGNLYGDTLYGGSSISACGGNGCGVVFELVHGKWTEKILYSFTGGDDGSAPATSLTFDGLGNLYSTAANGGAYSSGCNGAGCGTVFELKHGNNGKWTERTLHSFGRENGGAIPYGGVIFGSDGNLYGNTNTGGANNFGTIYELTP
jgi:uncharacterized repeat protein (TIGR03803 family)